MSLPERLSRILVGSAAGILKGASELVLPEAVRRTKLYHVLLKKNLDQLAIDDIVASWPAFPVVESRIAALFGPGELADKALEETRAKHPTPVALRAQLIRLRERWPDLRERLSSHLQSFQNTRNMLEAAGSPAEPVNAHAIQPVYTGILARDCGLAITARIQADTVLVTAC